MKNRQNGPKGTIRERMKRAADSLKERARNMNEETQVNQEQLENEQQTENVVTDVETLTKELEETKESFNLPQDNIYEGLSQKEMVIIKNLSVKPVALELLSQKTGLAPDELSSMLMMLEINGFIKTLPGKNFVLNV